MHAARHRRPVAPRARRLPVLLAVLATVLPLLVTSGAPLATAAPAGTSTLDVCLGNWAPVVRETTVNQGLGTYTPLVRGKTTLVRLFLTAPACAPAGRVRLVSATVRATEGGTTVQQSTGELGQPYPVLRSFLDGVAVDSPADPVLQFPALAARTTSTGSTAAFSASLTYEYVVSEGAAPQRATTPFTDVASAAVAPSSRGLRVLVVPMGDAAVTDGSQFPLPGRGTPVGTTYADTVVQTAMQTLSRTLPVPDGVTDLTASTGGVRYRLDTAALLDLGLSTGGVGVPRSADGTYCLTASRFSRPQRKVTTSAGTVDGPTVIGLLEQYLASWNTANPATPADRVLGVLWQGISGGSAQGCPEGLGSTNATTAFVRLFAGNTVTTSGTPRANPSSTGALTAMELVHTLGGVHPDDPRGSGTPHSDSVVADTGKTRRAYDTTLARWLASDTSGMRYSGRSSGYTSPTTGDVSPQNDTNVLLEKEDYAFVQCELGPDLPAASCPKGAERGSVGVAAASEGLVIAGTTDGTVEGTELVSSYDSRTEPTLPPAESEYRVVLRDEQGTRVPACAAGTRGCGPDGDLALRVSDVPSVHDDDLDPASVSTEPLRSVYAAVAVDPDAVSVEVWRGQVGEPCRPGAMPPGCLYARATSSPPTVVSFSSALTLQGLQDVTPVPGPDTQPALSADGELLVRTTGAGLVAQRRDPQTGMLRGAPSAALRGAEPSLSSDGEVLRVAFSDGGDLKRAVIDLSGPAPRFTDVVTVYARLDQVAPVLGSTDASSPSWSPDGTELAAAIDGGVWRLSSDGSPTNKVLCDLTRLGARTRCAPVIARVGAARPDWGGADPSGTIAYWSSDATGTGIRTIAPTGGAPVLRVEGGDEPAWGAGLLAYTAGGSVFVADPGPTDLRGRWTTLTQLTAAGVDAGPALARTARVLALSRDVRGEQGRDVLVGTLSDGDGDLEVRATTDGDPRLLRADLLLSCGRGLDPALVALRPATTRGEGPGTAVFRATYSATRACPGGTLGARVSNGWDVSGFTAVRTYPTEPVAPAPRPAITAPREGAVLLQHDTLRATRSALDVGTGTNDEASTTRWTLTGPAGSGFAERLVGEAETLRVDPPTAGFAPGTWTLTATVTGSSGSSGVSSTTYTVLPDPMHLGVNATVSFEPKTLFVPSSGSDVTVRVVPQHTLLTKELASTVRVVQVGTTAVDLPVTSRTSGWTSNGDGSWTAKFDRAALTALIEQSGRTGQYVQVVVRGGTGPSAFVGFDPVAPRTTPSGETS